MILNKEVLFTIIKQHVINTTTICDMVCVYYELFMQKSGMVDETEYYNQCRGKNISINQIQSVLNMYHRHINKEDAMELSNIPDLLNKVFNWYVTKIMVEYINNNFYYVLEFNNGVKILTGFKYVAGNKHVNEVAESINNKNDRLT